MTELDNRKQPSDIDYMADDEVFAIRLSAGLKRKCFARAKLEDRKPSKWGQRVMEWALLEGNADKIKADIDKLRLDGKLK